MKMKKIMMFAACALFAVVTNAATVGWTLSGAGTGNAGNLYDVFIIGQNGVTSVAQITALLDAGSSIDSYVFASSTIGANGNSSVTAGSSGKTLDAGTYTAFMVLFDSASPTSGSSKYVAIDGAGTLTKTIAATTASVSFATGGQSSLIQTASNWKSFGSSTPTDPTPEPTSGLLLLVGAGMLALRRKQK